MAGLRHMEFGGWCSLAGSRQEAAFAIRRKARARDKEFVSAGKRTRFRPGQRNKALARVLDRLVWQRKLSSSPVRIDRQHQAMNGKRNSRWQSTLGDYPSNRDSYHPKENFESLRNRWGYRNSANARASLVRW